MKKKKDDRIKRTDAVYATVDVKADGELKLNYDFQTDRVEIVGADPGSSRTERSHSRASGKPKVVSSIPSDGHSAFDANKALLAYDWAVAVDTNSIPTGKSRTAVCFSHYAQMPPVGFAGDAVYRPLGAFLITGIADGVNPEAIGWFLTIEHFLVSHLAHMGKVAIVVDSELGLHRMINSRQAGYYRNHLLPNHLTMVYASFDKDKESPQGTMLRASDKHSKQILKQFQSQDNFPILPVNSIDENFNAFAKINFIRQQ